MKISKNKWFKIKLLKITVSISFPFVTEINLYLNDFSNDFTRLW